MTNEGDVVVLKKAEMAWADRGTRSPVFTDFTGEVCGLYSLLKISQMLQSCSDSSPNVLQGDQASLKTKKGEIFHQPSQSPDLS